MSRTPLLFVAIILLGLLGACCSDKTAQQPTPSHCYTALEAYEQIRSTMTAWHADAIAISVDSLSPNEKPEQRIQEDGTSPVWSFTVVSLEASKGTHIRIWGGEVIVGADGIPGNEGPIELDAQPSFTIDSMAIDSDKASEIALRNASVSLDYTLIRASIRHFNSRNNEPTPPSWALVYMPQNRDVYDVLEHKLVFIDAMTGNVLWSDF